MSISDTEPEEIFNAEIVAKRVGIKTTADKKQGLWFNEDQLQSGNGCQYIECAETEESMDNYHTELCPVDYYAIRLIVSMDISKKFNMRVMMKTLHKVGQSWSIIPSTSLENELSTCVPMELYNLMTVSKELEPDFWNN